MLNKHKTVILIVLDGWGIGRKDFTNPIYNANLPNIDYIKKNFPTGALQASGISVGLPWGEEGNSEVGHMNMGAGRIIYQNYPKITLAIRNGEFFDNEVIKNVFEHAKKNNSNAHFIGLLTEANVHASFEHLEALIKFAEREKFPTERVCLHLITDGRDSPPHSAMNLINRLPNFSQLASVSGRYYSMDRDNHWDRVVETYKMLTGDGKVIEDVQAHVKEAVEKNLTDEYIFPALVGPQKRFISENDAVFFFNFREDRMKELVKPFIEKEFSEFPIKNFSNLHIASMIEYDPSFEIPVAFPPEKLGLCLSKILADHGKLQWRSAETEKYAHITYFFNSLQEEPFSGEFRVLIPSKTELRYDEHPEMRAMEITDRLLEAINEKGYDFILVNFANSDIIAHTGNYNATLEAVKIIDEQIGKITKAALDSDSVLLITADHGNAERLKNPNTGESETKHDPNPVPIYLVAKELQKPRSDQEISEGERVPIGVLSDITPTVLEIMGIPKPSEMSAQSLIDLLVE